MLITSRIFQLDLQIDKVGYIFFQVTPHLAHLRAEKQVRRLTDLAGAPKFRRTYRPSILGVSGLV